MHKLTVAEYARLMEVGETTVRRRIKSGELSSELIDGVTHIILERLPIDRQNDSQLTVQLKEQIEQQQAEIEYLRNELSEARQRTDTIIQQMQEDAAEAQERSDTIIMQLTRQLEQKTLALEDMRNRSLWSRIKMAVIRAGATPATEQRGV